MYQTILVPLDASPLSEAALGQLPHLVRPGSGVVLLRVIDPPVAMGIAAAAPTYASMGGAPISVSMPIESNPVAEEEHDRILDVPDQAASGYLEEQARGLRGLEVNVRTVVLEDRDPARAIAAQAVTERADLIVMSTHGRSGVVRSVLGSVADRVLHLTATPVLLVRPGSTGE